MRGLSVLLGVCLFVEAWSWLSGLVAGRGGRGGAWLLKSLAPLPASWQGQESPKRPTVLRHYPASPVLQDIKREAERYFFGPIADPLDVLPQPTVNWQFADKR